MDRRGFLARALGGFAAAVAAPFLPAPVAKVSLGDWEIPPLSANALQGGTLRVYNEEMLIKAFEEMWKHQHGLLHEAAKRKW